MTKFWIDFASTLFRVNAGELYLIGDEFHNFAPKGKILDPEAGKCLHWSNRLMSEGRGCGLVCLIASQRPQKVHNDTLTCCETLVAMRVIHKADRAAVQDWIEGCGDMGQGREVLNSLAGMARGEAYVWSPEVGFGPKRLMFPMFETFDSFAPPQLQKRVSNSDWGSVDLEAVREKLASVIEEAKANDPAELRRKLAEARREINSLKSKPLSEARSGVEIKPIPTLTAAERKRLAGLISSFERVEKLITKSGETIAGILREEYPVILWLKSLLDSKNLLAQPQRATEVRSSFLAARSSAARAPVVPAVLCPAPGGSENGRLPKAESSILRVLANFPDGKPKREVGVIAGYAHRGGAFNNAVGALRSKGYVMPGEPLRITSEGLAAHGPVKPLPTGDELYEYWLNHPDLGKAEREILRVLVKEARGGEWSKEEIAPATVSDRGTPYEPNGGSFNNAIGRLRTFELIEGKGRLKAAKGFFE
jgi:hypothetical protein